LPELRRSGHHCFLPVGTQTTVQAGSCESLWSIQRLLSVDQHAVGNLGEQVLVHEQCKAASVTQMTQYILYHVGATNVKRYSLVQFLWLNFQDALCSITGHASCLFSEQSQGVALIHQA